MLVQNISNLSNEIIVCKMASGEEIIARAGEVNDSTINISNPLSMVMVQDDSVDNQGMVAFAPWILGANDNTVLSLDRKHIVVVTKARKDAADQYSRAIGEEQPVTPSRSAPVALQAGRRGTRGR